MKPRFNDGLRPGQIYLFESGRKVAMAMAIGLWAERQSKKNPRSPIHIHLTGPAPFTHTTVTNAPGKRYHENLYAKLKAILVDQKRWPFGEE
jgi:hypothetical protein